MSQPVIDTENYPLIRELRADEQAAGAFAAQLLRDHPNLHDLLQPIVDRDAASAQAITDWLNGPHTAGDGA